MRPGKMPAQINASLHEAAEKALSADPDLKEGYRILNAEFVRDDAARVCTWLAQVATRTARYSISFNSTGIRHKAVLG